MNITIARKQILDRILERKSKKSLRPDDIDLKAMLREILAWANRFTPSESGSILLDDPILTSQRRKRGLLYFVACYGKGSAGIINTAIPAGIGIAGRTYSTGRPYISRSVKKNRHFYSEIDKKTKYASKSIICAPINIRGATIGVIELINCTKKINYNRDDLKLLEIFAEYTSTLIQNSLDAKKFGNMSIKDNLTGLYNDRYFYDRLTKDVQNALKNNKDVSLVFMDIDKFKEVNDSHGHLAGSRVLTEVGLILLECTGNTNSKAIRYGGDEFIVIMPDTNATEAEKFANALRKTIEDNIFLRHRYSGEKAIWLKGLLTASMGVASLRANIAAKGTAIEIRDSLIKQADTAMYNSKKNGKNMVTVALPKALRLYPGKTPRNT
ncbi:MAG: sensor domain-containing diguanylate cyclase [Deltaproteobacteria bacterium]